MHINILATPTALPEIEETASSSLFWKLEKDVAQLEYGNGEKDVRVFSHKITAEIANILNGLNAYI